MPPLSSPAQAIAWIEQHGVVLVSAQGPLPCLAAAIAGTPVKGSWWGHPEGRHIFAILEAVRADPQVLVCPLAGGKLTLVHRRLWPHLVRSAARFAPAALARVQEEHTASGRHARRETPFPGWVPHDVMDAAARIDEAAALAPFATLLGPRKS